MAKTQVSTKRKARVKKTLTEKKSAFKKIVQSLSFPKKPKWYFAKDPLFIVFSPFGIDSPIETIGIDVGSKHLGISGLSPTLDRNAPTENLHDSADIVTDLLFKHPDFEFFRRACVYRIELQVQLNTPARAMACALRSICRILCLARGIVPNVEYVHGELKYAIACRYSEAARNDSLRKQKLSGKLNVQKRKVLGFNDTRNLFIENGEKNMNRFLQIFSQFVDQLYDMTDAYLVARTYYEKDLKIVRAKKPEKQESEDDTDDYNSVVFEED